ELGGEARPDFVGAVAARVVENAPAGDRKVVRAAHAERGPGAMELGESAAEAGAMERLDAPRPQPVEEAHDRRRPPAKLAKRHAVARAERRRAGQAGGREML